MRKLLRFLHFSFVPVSTEFALFVLRVWLSVSILVLHGWGKLTGFNGMVSGFADPLGVGRTASLSLAIFAEVFCAVLLALGLLARFAALGLVILTAVAFFLVHGRVLSGPGSGELAFVYLAGFLTLFLAGPGSFALDRRIALKG